MAAGAWTPTDTLREYLCMKGEFLDSGQTGPHGTIAYKIALWTNTNPPVAGSTTYAALAGGGGEVSSTNTGYTTAGAATTVSHSGTTTLTIDTSDVQWTAGSANLTARYAIMYETSGGRIFGYCLLDSTPADVTVTNGNTLTIQISANGVYQVL